MIRESLLNKIETLAGEYGEGRDAMLPILQNLQKEYGWVGSEIVNEVARRFGLSQTEVFSVASFYHFLDMEKRGRYVIRICRSISCALADPENLVTRSGGDKGRILRALEAELGITMGGTTADGLYTLDWANCMGMCDRGPAMMVNDD
ncbi:MAG TPA: NAD(P)H-dependent oxidoreductase subunit E, partial [Rectinemataceae bacterium]|nr:NAD(P)H-dependent oxidoreductase subunit E [Rectinemataceae bacterium]